MWDFSGEWGCPGFWRTRPDCSWSGRVASVLSFFGCLFLSGGVCTKLEHHRTFVGPLVGWWVFVPVGCMFELVRGVGFGVRPVRRVAGIPHHVWLVIGWDRTDHYVNLFLGFGGGIFTSGVPLGLWSRISWSLFSNASYAPRFSGALGYSFGPRG